MLTKTKHKRRRQTGFAKRWGRAKPPKLPELMKPDGLGCMPLSCALRWIATHGGTLEINLLDEAIWREAFKDLRDHIVSGNVNVVGERADGVSEDVSGVHFASCSVSYPFSDRPVLYNEFRGNEFWLILHPYLDDEHWRRVFDDRLVNRHGVRWRRLQALKANVARWWPFVSINANATLTQADATLSASASLQPQPGRPSGMHLVEEEHRRRWQRGIAQTAVSSEARALAEWYGAEHHNRPALRAGTIENKIRFEHRRRVAERSKTPRN
jgi:hypothetical protein